VTLGKWAPVTPAKLVCPTWDFTRGPEVADLCALLGYIPMPEQELWLDAVFAIGSDGLPAVTDATDIAGRQNLKTGEFVMTAFGWLFITKEERVLWSAHEFGTTRDAFLLMRGLLEKHAWADAKVRQYYASSNYTAIALTDGRVLEFTARTTSQGRGKSAPKAIWDEGLELRAEHLGAQDAVKSTFPWAQTLIGSSGLKSYSEVLHPIVDKAWAGQLGAKDFFREFRDDLPGECRLGPECTHVYGSVGCRLDEPERWKRNNPATDRIHEDGRGLTLEAIARERRNQPDPMIFARERMGWHDKLVIANDQVFSEEAWLARRDPKSKISGDRVLALQVSPNRTWSAVVAGGRNANDLIHLEVPSKRVDREVRQYARWQGTDKVLPWFRAYLRKRVGTTTRLLILAGSSAVSLIPALERLNDDPELGDLELHLIPESTMPAACNFFQDSIANEGIVHVGDPELKSSVLAISKRMVGDRTFVWSPRSSSGDITAAIAATLLAWHLEQDDDTNPMSGIAFGRRRNGTASDS
jgi:hypothetical protein